MNDDLQPSPSRWRRLLAFVVFMSVSFMLGQIVQYNDDRAENIALQNELRGIEATTWQQCVAVKALPIAMKGE